MLHFAPPNRESQQLTGQVGTRQYSGNIYKPKHFEQLVSFRSRGDWVVPLAQLTHGNLEAVLKAAGCRISYELLKKFLIFKGFDKNFFDKFDSYVPNAGSILEVTKQNIIRPMQRKPFEHQHDKVIVDLETQIDSHNPGHSGLMQATLGLLEVLKTLYYKYPHYVVHNGSFYLDVDSKTTPPSHIILASHNLSDAYQRPLKTMLIDPAAPNADRLNLISTLQVLQANRRQYEDQYSDLEKKRYLLKYSKKMES